MMDVKPSAQGLGINVQQVLAVPLCLLFGAETLEPPASLLWKLSHPFPRPRPPHPKAVLSSG